MLQVEQILQNRYRLQRQIGKNGVRQTWLATDLQASAQENSQVIVKLLAFGGNVQWDDLKLFEREAQILQHLHHPRIPQYVDYFCIDDRTLWFGLVQKYIPGESLKEKLAQGKRFTEKQVRKVAIEVLNILTVLHELHPAVLHRDIKPSNLIWGEDNHIYLVDFGAVQDKAAKEGVTFTIVGTYGYAPMEQYGGRAIPASDLYALGATLIHLLTGTPPADLPQSNLRIQFTDRVTTSPSLVCWLEKMTQPSPEQRFTTARQALESLKSGQIVSQSVRKNGVVSQRPEPINNSGCGINNTKERVPEEILGWNWGAFLMPWFWLWTNQVWVGLLCFLPSIGWVMTIILGVNGNEWAWKSRRWRSVQHFKEHQRGWAIAGMLIGAPFSIILWMAAIAFLTSFL
ncbi:serine/threonine protein kinase [Fischerella thermalis]|uniref:Serine/threonine protein kinase n=1 Tax=Fischerella thermalis CCMEE 5318 TaxID=2019666 RepID=A0A2N6LND0_9CYAN|nr:serine/threonine-protein kinase [Fischerella thermalis]PMB26947.1 serine/threonine protein kinase [Fischerella thermalis CCMEE 5318]